MPILASDFRQWESPPDAGWQAIVRQYERGYAGAWYSEAAREQFLDGISVRTGEEVCSALGYEESAAGELVYPCAAIQKVYPKALPGPGQVEGDCVSHSQKNANLLTLVTEALAGIPDAVSGHIEQPPKVSAEAERNGVLSTEAIYYFRSTKPGHGWFCHEAARVTQRQAGCVLRTDYPELGINLTRYGKQTVNAFNRQEVSENMADVFDDHVIREATEIKTFEALRDLLARGFGVSTCGSEGWENTRDENGVSKRKGKWAHAMAVLAVDDRPWAHSKYGGPLILIQNSWSKWNKGPRKIHGTDLEIPHGAYWSRWNDAKNRSFIAMAGANGWARRKLPDYLGGLR